MESNSDDNTVAGFGDEWERYDQSSLTGTEHIALFERYFSIFPWSSLPPKPVGFDLGCGSGRWAKLVAPKVNKLHCIDPSVALEVARNNLKDCGNCTFHSASVESIPLEDESMDFGYSLGVLHHVPDTQAGLSACTKKLKKGAPFLLYLYYALDNKPLWYRILWKISDIARRKISKLPNTTRYLVCKIIAAVVYLPLAKSALILEKIGLDVKNFPLSIYRHTSFYTMSTDALDRFGTQLEQRFTKKQITQMMTTAGLEKISFSTEDVFWCSIGFKA